MALRSSYVGTVYILSIRLDVAPVNIICYAPGMAPERPYHHGNLKPALLRAAVELIAEVGPAAFTLREVARRAGISHNAPYRHFREKDELVAAVAAEGFERLAEALSEPGKPSRARNPALRRFH